MSADPSTPGRAHRWLVRFLGLLTHIFFSKVEVTGLENVPLSGGGIVIAWHPNGLIDGVLILSACPRQVVVGARHGLFGVPLLGHLLRALDSVPLYRAQDRAEGTSEEARRAANASSLASLAAAATRSFVAIFPEGVTHDEPQLLELRTGAARLYYSACALSNQKGAPSALPVVLPVGLHYDKKHAFRSRVLVAFHPPIELGDELLPASGLSTEQQRGQVEGLTALIERTLSEVVHATESWELNHTLHRGRKLVRAERAARAQARPAPSDMAERRLGFARFWVGYYARMKTDPEETKRLVVRIRRYDEAMRILRLEDRDLDRQSRRDMARRLLLLTAEAITVYLLLPPLVLLGYIVNLPTALLLKVASTKISESRKEQAGLKVALGVVAFPITWLSVSVIVGWARPALWTRYSWTPPSPALAALFTLLVCVVGGLFALRYHRLSRDLARTLRALLTRRRRIEAIRRMRERRSQLYDLTMQLAEGLDLPGQVRPDGRIVAAPRSPPTSGGQ